MDLKANNENTIRDYLLAADGKHYWNCWTRTYNSSVDGYIEHAFCEEENTGKTLCGCRFEDTGLISIPHELSLPTCLKCRKIMENKNLL